MGKKKAASKGKAPKKKGFRDRIVWLRRIKASELKPAPLNYRTHGDIQKKAVKAVLERIGWAGALIARECKDGSFELIDGHCRQELSGSEEVPVLILDVTQKEAREILATFDPLTEMAGIDADAVETLLAEVGKQNADIDAILGEVRGWAGIELDEEPVEAPEAQMDRAAELQKKWKTKLGQLWEIKGKAGTHRLLCGDSTKEADVERVMGVELGRLVVTDPPYGVDYDGGTTKRAKLAGDATPDLYGPSLTLAARFSDDKCPVYLWHSDSKSAAVSAAVSAAGYERRCTIVWNKNVAQFGALGAQYKTKHEPCYYLYKKGKTPRWFGPTNEVTVWDVDRNHANDHHPTEKPVAVMSRPIENSSETGDVVLDLFLGSGTTMVAAEQLGRRCFGLELEPKYCAVILERMTDMGCTCKAVK